MARAPRHSTAAPALDGPTRRGLLGGGVAIPVTAALLDPAPVAQAAAPPAPAPRPPPAGPLPDPGEARWLWYPSQRTLPNTVVLFRKELDLPGPPTEARLWVSADSRYRLSVNGTRVAFGPAPCDPRLLEIDPVDLTPHLRAGRNAIGIEVLFYGHGDGTWPLGKPGLLCFGRIRHGGGAVELRSDPSWRCHLSRAHRPGQYKRWYLRALQEEFDARRHPYGWDQPGFAAPEFGAGSGREGGWLPPMVLDVGPGHPPLASSYRDYLGDASARPEDTAVQARPIAMLHEEVVVARPLERHRVRWRVPVRDYFDLEIPDACASEPGVAAHAEGDGFTFTLPDDPRAGVALTYDLPEQMVGFPGFSVVAPAGTEIELMVQEGHVPGGPPVMNTHRSSWSRWICRAGDNRFEALDYESCRFLQLHVHRGQGTGGPVRVGPVHLRRRRYPFAQAATLRTGEPALDRLISAGLNTTANAAQETIVDGMGRERQQYSGDIGHALHVLHLLHGERALPARFLQTFARGLTRDGYFLDCWPAHDRLARLPQRQLDLTPWGPILDHGVGFTFDAYHHYLYTGEADAVRGVVPALARFARYLDGLRGRDDLLPVEDVGVPSVWIDHEAYRLPRHKQCAFNLYAAAALGHALAPLCRAIGDAATARWAAARGKALLAATVRRFWDPARKLFVASRPWQAEDGVRLCDRSLATSVLFRQCPGGAQAAALDALAAPPPELGLSYPANAVWRTWALAEGGRTEVVLAELRARWAALRSVRENNTLSEHWEVTPDTRSQWSHFPVAPLLGFVHGLAGLRVLEPGMGKLVLRPRLHDLPRLELTLWTPRGPLALDARRAEHGHALTVTVPGGTEVRVEGVVNGRSPRRAGVALLTPGTHELALPAA